MKAPAILLLRLCHCMSLVWWHWFPTEWQHVGYEVGLNYDPWSNTTDVPSDNSCLLLNSSCTRIIINWKSCSNVEYSNCSCLLLRKFKFELTDLPKLNNTSCVTIIKHADCNYCTTPGVYLDMNISLRLLKNAREVRAKFLKPRPLFAWKHAH